MLVRQILNAKDSSEVVTVTPDTSLDTVSSILAAKHIGGVIVSDDGETALGILSERDIVRVVAESGASCLKFKAGDVMTRNLQTCGPDDSTDSVLQRMTDGRFRHMPVIEAEKMIGIVTIGDLVKARLSELAMEKDALQGMIMGH